MRLMCRLRGSDEYCVIGRGICCASCGIVDECDKACLNSPSRCGYAGQVRTRPGLEGGGERAGTKAAD